MGAWSGLRVGAFAALVPALLLFAVRLPGGTTATLQAQTANPGSTFALAALYAPTGLTGGAAGHDVPLSWSAGQNGSGYAVLGAAAPAGNCSGLTLAGVGSTAATSFTNSGRYTPQGTWFCYQVQTTYGPWTSVLNNPTTTVQIGFVATTVQMINDGNHAGCSGSGAQVYGQAGRLDCGDQFVFTFNQAVNTSSGPTGSNSVCVNRNPDTVWLGSTLTTGNCQTTETVNLGKLAGGTVGDCDCRFQASYAWSNGNRTLTVTVGARIAGSKSPALTGTWSFTPTTTTSKLLSSTGAFHICDNNTGGGNCLPTTG